MSTPLERFKHATIRQLRALERFTHTDNVYLFKNGSLVFGTQLVNVLNGFGLYLLIAHFLPKEVYGQYKYFLALFSLFSFTTFTGTEIAVQRAVAEGNDGAVPAGFRLKLIGGALGSVISLLVAGYYAFAGRADLAAALVLLALFAPWIYAANVYGTALSGKKRFAEASAINVITSLLSFVGMVFAFIFLRDPVQLFAAFLVTSSVLLLGYAYARRTLTNTHVGKDTLSFATHMSLLDILATAANNLDAVLVFHFLGPASLATYAFATIPVEQMKGFLKTFQTIALPKFTTLSLSHLRKTLVRKVLLFILGITFLMLIYIVLVPYFFQFFFPAYAASVPYSRVYSLSLIFGVPGSLLSTIFMAKGLKKETTLFNVVNYSAQIILLVLGAWLYGLWGVIVARIAARTLMFFTTSAMLHATSATEVLPTPMQAEGA